MWILTWRQKLTWRHMPGQVLAVVALPVLLFLTMKFVHRQQHFYMFVGFYLQLILPFFCLTVFGDIIREELQANTLVFLTTRSLTRAQIYLLKFLSTWIWTEILMLIHLLLLAIVAWLCHVDGFANLLALSFAAQFLEILVFGALSALLGVLQRRFLVLGLLYGLVVEVGIGQIPTNINTLSMLRQIKSIVGLDPSAPELLGWTSQGVLKAVCTMLAASAVFLALGAIVFACKEFHKNEETHK